MMTLQSASLLSRLPGVRGKLIPNAPLKDFSWFRVGGPAEVLFQPADTEDLAHFLKNLPAEIPVFTLGVGSNVLIRDGGVPGIVIKLGPEFSSIKIDGAEIHVGAAALDFNVSRAAAKAGLAGLEFLSGIPGSIGGALRMNAGAYGGEMRLIVEKVAAVDRKGQIETVGPEIMGLTYRRCAAPEDWIFTSAVLRGLPGDKEEIEKRMKEIQASRATSQPLRERTCGSTFANPPGHKAWELIEQAGCRGLRIGGARMSEKHCNFMINDGTATAEDLEKLGEEVRRRVLEKSGLELRWEIRMMGIQKSDVRCQNTEKNQPSAVK